MIRTAETPVMDPAALADGVVGLVVRAVNDVLLPIAVLAGGIAAIYVLWQIVAKVIDVGSRRKWDRRQRQREEEARQIDAWRSPGAR